MSTTELARLIDERTPEERAWMAEYLNRAIALTASEAAELKQSSEDIVASRNCRKFTAEEFDAWIAHEPSEVAR